MLGVVDAVRAAQIETATDFNFTPYVVAGALFVFADHPDDPGHRLGRDARLYGGSRAGATSTGDWTPAPNWTPMTLLEARGVRKSFGDRRGAATTST